MKNKKKKEKIITIIVLVILILVGIFLFVFSKKNESKHLEYSNDVQIKYAYGLGVATIESLNKEEPYLDILKVELDKNELKEFKKIINNFDFTLDSKEDSVGVAGIYEIIIDNQTILLDQEEALYSNDSKKFYKIKVSTEFFDFVSDVIYENVEPKHEKIKTDEIFLSNDEIGSTTFSSKEMINEILNSIRYVKLKRAGNDISFTPDYFIDFKNGITLTTYKGSKTALYKNSNSNEEYYVFLYNDPIEYLRGFLTNKIMEDESN